MYPRRVYIEAIKRAGIPVYLPCLIRSAADFTIDAQTSEVLKTSEVCRDGIRTGLGAIAFRGQLLDYPIVDRARQTVALAKTLGVK